MSNNNWLFCSLVILIADQPYKNNNHEKTWWKSTQHTNLRINERIQEHTLPSNTYTHLIKIAYILHASNRFLIPFDGFRYIKRCHFKCNVQWINFVANPQAENAFNGNNRIGRKQKGEETTLNINQNYAFVMSNVATTL